MKPKIALDLDGTLSKSNEMMLSFYNYKHRTDHKIQDCTEWELWKVIPEMTEDDFWDIYKWMQSTGILAQARIMDHKLPYYIEHLQQHYDIEVVTNRDAMGGILAKEFLRNHQFPKLKVKLASDKPKLGHDILVDDSPQLYEWAKEYPNMKFIVHAAPWNQPQQPLPENVIRLEKWSHIHDHLLICHKDILEEKFGPSWF